MTEDKVEETKKEIQDLGLKAIQEYFKVDLTNADKDFLYHLHNRAKMGMNFEREMNLAKRAIENNYIRIFKQVSENKSEFKKYIKKSLPQYTFA